MHLKLFNIKTKEIKTEDIWNDKKMENARKAILSHSATQSKKRLLTNQLLSIQYKLDAQKTSSIT